jgi:hypothetical protein
MTVIKHWKLYKLYRAFNKWKEVWQMSKRKREQNNAFDSTNNKENTPIVNEEKSEGNETETETEIEIETETEMKTEKDSNTFSENKNVSTIKTRHIRTKKQNRNNKKQNNSNRQRGSNSLSISKTSNPTDSEKSLPQKKRRTPRGMPPVAVVRFLLSPLSLFSLISISN